MSETTGEAFEPGGNYTNERNELLRMVRESNATKDNISRLWRQQARSLNRFSRALEDFSAAQVGRTRSGPRDSGFTSRGARAIELTGKQSNDHLSEISKTEKEQAVTLQDIYRAITSDDNDRKIAETQTKILLGHIDNSLVDILKVLRNGGIGGGGGLASLFGGGGGGSWFSRKAKTVAAEAATIAEDAERAGKVGFFARQLNRARSAGQLLGKIPGVSRIGALGGTIARGVNALGELPGISTIGKIATPALAAGSKFLSEVNPALAGVGGALSLSDLTNERGTAFFGNQQTGILGSRATNYLGTIASGATLGAAAGAPFAGVGALPGAVIGGATGLGSALYADYAPQINGFAKSITNKIGGIATDAMDWISRQIPSWQSLSGALSGIVDFSSLGNTIGNELSDLMHGIGGLVSGAINKSKEALKAGAGAVGLSPDTISNIGAGVKTGASAVASGISGAASAVTGGISGAYHSIFGGGKTIKTFDTTLNPQARGLLDTIAGTESPGYNVMYGGKTFSDYSQHPNVATAITRGPNAGLTSTAAGRYQFIKGTWDEAQKALGLKDFSPASQDKAAWWLAQRDYNKRTGRDLSADLQSSDPAIKAQIGATLSKTWTSLPGGIEAGTNQSKFAKQLAQNTQQESVVASAEATPSAINVHTGKAMAAATPSATEASNAPPPIVVSQLLHKNQPATATPMPPTTAETSPGINVPRETTRDTAVTANRYLPPPPPPPPAPPPTAVAENTRNTPQTAGSGLIDIDAVPMYIGENGIVYVNGGAMT